MIISIDPEDATEDSNVAESNPYLLPITNDQQGRTAVENGTDNGTEQNDETDRAAEDKKRKQRRRRRVALTSIALLLLASLFVVVTLFRGRSTKVEYRQSRPGVLPPAPNVSSTSGRDSRTDQAILEAQRLINSGNPPVVNSQAATSGEASTNVVKEGQRNLASDSQHPFKFPDSLDATPNVEASERTSSAASAIPRDEPLRSQRNSEISLYVGERNDEHSRPASSERQQSTVNSVPSKNTNKEEVVVLPPFGSMLPVRTIGALYTLRNSALVRFELTRDMIGSGWSMKRGTILVGTTKGGEQNRAYISIVGFIDPESGGLVKLGGDVRGGDGATGLIGKSKQVDSRWARVLRQLGNAALDVTGAFLGGRNNGTVIISDTARQPQLSPISGELEGVLGPRSNPDRMGFVEVVAGTPGYVMVTDLPTVIRGIDAKAELNEQTLTSLSDVDAIRLATGISERQFAELIANGSVEEIKATLNRLSPEMRKIALAVMQR